MAAEVFKGAGGDDSITAFLAQVRFWTSSTALRHPGLADAQIHRYLGIGFALLILPVNLAITAAIVMLLNAALWAPALARVTRSVAALHRRQDDARDPVPAAARDIKQEAKSFVDVTVDRVAQGGRARCCCWC